jgi:deoxyribonuclease V
MSFLSMGSFDPVLDRRLLEVQRRIASQVVLEDRFSLASVAGVDQAFVDDMVLSAAVVLDREYGVKAKASSRQRTSFPYRPGYLSFREGPAAIKAVRALPISPTLLFVDGCGINHPRRSGLASYIGVITDLPTIGVSKSVLCGSFDLPQQVGEATPLVYEGSLVGYVLKSRKGCRPIVVAPGHKISVDSALEVARCYLMGHKLPEPCRLAHESAGKLRVDLLRAREAAL